MVRIAMKLELRKEEKPTRKPQTQAAPPLALDVRGLSKKYILSKAAAAPAIFLSKPQGKEFWALKDVSFALRRGDRLGIIGHNGAGKSTLLKILSRIILPTTGEADLYGRATSLLEIGTGFNPNLTGLQNIYLNAALHGLTRHEIEARLETIIAFSEIGHFVNEPVRVYSTGMRSRLGFAVAAHLDPDILMLDEVLSVGDSAFQRKCLERMEDMTGHGRTLLFVSHATSAVRKFCDRCLWLDHGQVVMDADSLTVCEAYESQMMQVRGTYQASAEEAPAPRSGGAADAQAATAQDDPDQPVARLVSAAVLDERGEPSLSIRIDTPCSVEIVFDVLELGRRIEPALHFRNERGEMLFVVACTSAEWKTGVNEQGRYRAAVQIPRNLLNEGLHFVTVSLATADPMIRHEEVKNAVSFSVYELANAAFGETARGNYSRSFPGGLRPRLEWRIASVK